MRLEPLLKKIHIYLGLILIVPLIIFAVSGFILNHRWPLWETWEQRVETVEQIEIEVPQAGNSAEKAKAILAQLGLKGEISLFVHEPENNKLRVMAHRPGHIYDINLELGSGSGSLKRTRTDGWFVLRDLHKLAGLHSGLKEKKNWGWTLVWSAVMDLSALAMLVLVATGAYLMVKRNRKIISYGVLVMAAGGAVSLWIVLMLSVF
ncbi:MAG: hypothetical protein FVQ81_05935 [Candidatus Glassbacteria bacterium]|nr:hypothetical protein [Candidatus Glassbacteria bacterium]